MARTHRFQFHLGPFRAIFLILLLIACASGTAKAAGQGGRLFLLTGTSLADTSQTFPVRLYAVSTGHKLKLFRTVVSGSEGISGILDDMRDEVYVTFPSNYGVSRAPTKVSIIHEQRPWVNDVVTFNPTVMFVWPYASVTAEGPGQSSYALFVLLPPHSPNGHVAFMRFVRSSAMRLVGISGNPPAKGPRVIRNKWSLYSHLAFSGTPGGPNSYFTPDAAIESGKLVMRPGGENIPVDLAPPTLPASATGHEIRIVAANRRFVVTWFWRASDRFAPAVFYVHDRQLGKWRDLKFQWNLPQSRIFGSWLATIAMSYVGIGPGGWHDTNPGRMDESHPWVKYEHPDVRFEFGALRMGDRIPGTLILDNLADGRRITLKTNEEDSEILDVRKNGLVLYRVNNEVFSTKIEGDKLSAPKLVVKGEDVPEVHWAFWSKAGTEPRALAEGAPRQKKPFTLTLAAPKQPHRAGQPLLLHLTVTSTSDRAQRVPVTRGVFWVRLAYQVHVLDQRGQPPPPAPELVPKRKDQVVLGGGSMPSRRLEPGKSLSDLVNVTSLYDLSQPGKYKIWIAEPYYRGPHIPNGPVRSNTVTVTIVK